MPGPSSASAPGGEALATRIRAAIEDFLSVPENNNLGFETNTKAWDGFLLGFSSGSDDLYGFLKRHIGDFHWTPAEAFALGAIGDDHAVPLPALSGAHPAGGELTVVSWALCHTEETKAANRAETRVPSEPWARARVFGQRCNRALHRVLVKALNAEGYEAVAPALLPQAVEKESRSFGHAHTWSERHVAYVSGLGTFGLAGGLITERGQAHRLGSVIVRAVIEPTPRRYQDPFAYCLFYSRGSCGACARRCPAGSVSEGGRDKAACARYLDTVTAEYVKREYGFDGYGCGLCQTGVPCESRIPQSSEGRPASGSSSGQSR